MELDKKIKLAIILLKKDLDRIDKSAVAESNMLTKGFYSGKLVQSKKLIDMLELESEIKLESESNINLIIKNLISGIDILDALSVGTESILTKGFYEGRADQSRKFIEAFEAESMLFFENMLIGD